MILDGLGIPTFAGEDCLREFGDEMWATLDENPIVGWEYMMLILLGSLEEGLAGTVVPLKVFVDACFRSPSLSECLCRFLHH